MYTIAFPPLLGETVSNLWAYVSYFTGSVILLALGLSVYAAVTPYREISLIREGNSAAAWSLGGTALGLATAIASAAAHSLDMLDMLIWAGIAVAAQLVSYLALGRIIPGLRTGIEEDRQSFGIFLGAVSLAVGILNAGALTW